MNAYDISTLNGWVTAINLRPIYKGKTMSIAESVFIYSLITLYTYLDQLVAGLVKSSTKRL